MVVGPLVKDLDILFFSLGELIMVQEFSKEPDMTVREKDGQSYNPLAM